ncbi:MAG TPA: carbohydrate kinase [Mycobacteriales bacterium]|nr:carbohydrate kinase [Mycobacteriales bacterium]
MIAVCGEALVDLLPTGPDSYRAAPGGSPANTAVALARLGTPVALLARLSGDGFGALLRRHLADNGVDLAAAVAAAEPSSLAIVSRDASGAASYRFVMDGTADWQWTDDELALPEGAVAVHTGSLALAKAPAVERFLLRARASATVSVDPNLRPALLTSLDDARRDVERWVALADVFKASSEDLALLHPGEDPLRVARSWRDRGAAVVVVTGGADGAHVLVGDEVLHAPGRRVDVVDTVGAGDTFTAGFLSVLHARGLLGGRLDAVTPDDARAALDVGLRAAAVTCSRPGADPPRADELPD